MKSNSVIKSLGIYYALNASAVQFNSIVFRVVVGFLVGAPLKAVAYITCIEYLLNFILEVPTGRIADKYGRIPMAIIGHVSVILGLSCGYVAASGFINDENTIHIFYMLHGVFIGFCRPLISGSIDGFYKDAMKRKGESEADLGFSISSKYGRYLTTIYITLAFIVLIVFDQTLGAQHAFVPGILLWVMTTHRLYKDYLSFGDSSIKTETPIKKIFQVFKQNRNILVSTYYNFAQWVIKYLVFGYFLVTFGREFAGQSKSLQWMTMIAFMLGSQGFGWILKSVVIPKMIYKMSEKQYLTTFLAASFFAGLLGLSTLDTSNLSVNFTVAVFIFGMFTFAAMSAVERYSKDKLTKEVASTDYAMFLSIQNMPGYTFVVLHGLYYIFLGTGTPSLNEIFSQVAITSIMFIIGVYILDKSKERGAV